MLPPLDWCGRAAVRMTDPCVCLGLLDLVVVGWLRGDC